MSFNLKQSITDLLSRNRVNAGPNTGDLATLLSMLNQNSQQEQLDAQVKQSDMDRRQRDWMAMTGLSADPEAQAKVDLLNAKTEIEKNKAGIDIELANTKSLAEQLALAQQYPELAGSLPAVSALIKEQTTLAEPYKEMSPSDKLAIRNKLLGIGPADQQVSVDIGGLLDPNKETPDISALLGGSKVSAGAGHQGKAKVDPVDQVLDRYNKVLDTRKKVLESKATDNKIRQAGVDQPFVINGFKIGEPTSAAAFQSNTRAVTAMQAEVDNLHNAIDSTEDLLEHMRGFDPVKGLSDPGALSHKKAQIIRDITLLKSQIQGGSLGDLKTISKQDQETLDAIVSDPTGIAERWIKGDERITDFVTDLQRKILLERDSKVWQRGGYITYQVQTKRGGLVEIDSRHSKEQLKELAELEAKGEL